jgi:cytochrome c-type biogenesis protein CcmH
MKALMTAITMVFLTLASSALAIGVDENRFTDPAQEAHARDLMRQFRCLVCQNESIEDSDAQLAGDLRTIVRERMRAGDSDVQIKAFLTARYGDWVLLKPPFKARTAVLWIGPFVLLGAGGLAIAIRARRRSRNASETEPLSADEKKRLKAVLKDEEGQQS